MFFPQQKDAKQQEFQGMGFLKFFFPLKGKKPHAKGGGKKFFSKAVFF